MHTCYFPYKEEISVEGAFLKENDEMAWTLLLVAGFFEIVWATLLKFTDGFTQVWPSVGTVVAMGVSMICMSFALRVIPMGTAYAVWNRNWCCWDGALGDCVIC